MKAGQDMPKPAKDRHLAEDEAFLGKFKDDLGRVWAGFAAAGLSADEKDKFNLTLKLTRAKK